jgi:hypothetical protein
MLILAAAGPLILLLAYVIYRLCGIFHPYRAFIKVKKAPPPTAPMIFLTSQELRAYDGVRFCATAARGRVAPRARAPSQPECVRRAAWLPRRRRRASRSTWPCAAPFTT